MMEILSWIYAIAKVTAVSALAVAMIMIVIILIKGTRS